MVFYVVPMVPKVALVNIGQTVVGDDDCCGTVRDDCRDTFHDDDRGTVRHGGRGANPKSNHDHGMIHKMGIDAVLVL